MRKFLAIVLAIALLSVAGTASAVSIKTSYSIEAPGIMTDQDGATMDYAIWIYGVSIYADAASSEMGIYDCNTFAELSGASTTIYPRYEIGEPTQYEVTTQMFDKPFYFSDGVGAIIKTGVGFVHYGPNPANF